MELIINGSPLALCETDELIEAITLLKTTLTERAEGELRELDAKRERLLALLPITQVDPPRFVAKKSNGRNGKPASKTKYRDPETGKTWGGRGKRPAWFDADRADEYRMAA